MIWERLKPLTKFMDSKEQDKDPASSQASGWYSPYRLAMVLMLIYCSLALVGGVRFTTHLGVNVSLIISILIHLVIGALALPVTPMGSVKGHARVLYHFFFFILLAVIGTWLFNPYFNGLPSVGGGDAGNHVALQWIFVNDDWNVYEGFLGLYATNHFLEQIFSWDSFKSYRATYYLSLIVMLALTFLIAGKFAQGIDTKEDKNRVLKFIFFFFLFLLPPFIFTFLPMMHYSQGDGFYTHIFGFYPLFFAWFCYALINSRTLRILALAYGVILTRFTYGLNMSEYCIAVGILLLFEMFTFKSRPWKYLMILPSLACFGVAWLVYVKLSVVLPWDGAYIRRPILLYNLPGLYFGSAFLVGSAILMHIKNGLDGYRGVVVRASYFAGFFVLATAGAIQTFIWLEFPIKYYIIKYILGAEVIAGFAIPLSMAALTIDRVPFKAFKNPKNELSETWNWILKGASLRTLHIFFLLVILVQVARGPASPWHAFFQKYLFVPRNLGYIIPLYLFIDLFRVANWREWFRFERLIFPLGAIAVLYAAHGSVPNYFTMGQRIRRAPPFARIGILSDRQASRIIDETLKSESKKFGGYLTTAWASSNFINTSFGNIGRWEFYRSGAVKKKPGNCVFWDASHYDIRDFPNVSKSVNAQVTALQESKEKQCASYTKKWLLGERHRQKICYVCF